MSYLNATCRSKLLASALLGANQSHEPQKHPFISSLGHGRKMKHLRELEGESGNSLTATSTGTNWINPRCSSRLFESPNLCPRIPELTRTTIRPHFFPFCALDLAIRAERFGDGALLCGFMVCCCPRLFEAEPGLGDGDLDPLRKEALDEPLEERDNLCGLPDGLGSPGLRIPACSTVCRSV